MLSLDGDIATVRATLDHIRGQKILVGHSYGGFVISNAATAAATFGAGLYGRVRA